MRRPLLPIIIISFLMGTLVSSASTGPPSNFSIGGLFTMTFSGLAYDFNNPQPLNMYACFNTTTGCRGGASYSSVRLQLDRINNNTSILPRTQLILDPIDDQASASNGFFYAEKLYSRGNRIVIGPQYSTPTINAALVAGVFNAPLLGYSASSPSLANKVQYPNFWRTCQNDGTQGSLMAWFAKTQFNWNRVALLSTTDAYGQGGSSKFEETAAALNMTVISVESFALLSTPDQVEVPLRRILRSGARVIIYFGQYIEFLTVIGRADALGMFNNQTAWFVSDSSVQFVAATNPTDVTRRVKTQGLIAITPDNGAGSPEFTDYANAFINRQLTPNPLENYRPQSGSQISYYTAFAADAINVIAHTLHNLLEVQNNYDFTQQQFMAEMSKIDIPGISGRLAFDENQDRVGLHYTLQNLNNGVWSRVGVYSDGHYAADPGAAVVWHDGTTIIPLDDALPAPPPPPATSRLATSTFIALVVVTVCLMAVLVLAFIGLCRFRRTRVMYAASPTMMAVVLLGAGLILSAVLVDTMDQVKWRCTLSLWLFNIGFTAAVGSMLLKTFRVHKIFNSKTIKVISLSDRKLLQIMSILILFDVIVLALRTSLAPYVLDEHESCNFEDGDAQTAADALTFILIVVKALMIAAAACLSYAVRNLPQLYNESAYLAMAIYNCALLGAAWIAIRYAVDFSTHPSTVTIMECAIMLVSVAVVTGLIFIPKFVDLYQSEKQRMFFADLRKRSHSHSREKPPMRKNLKGVGVDDAHLNEVDFVAGMDETLPEHKKKTGPQTSAQVIALLERALKDQQISLDAAFKDMEMSTKRTEDKKNEICSLTDLIFQINCEIDYYRDVGSEMSDADVATLFRDRLKQFHLVPDSDKSSSDKSPHPTNAYAAVRNSMEGINLRPRGLSFSIRSPLTPVRPLPKTRIPSYVARFHSAEWKPSTLASSTAANSVTEGLRSTGRTPIMTRSNSRCGSQEFQPNVFPMGISAGLLPEPMTIDEAPDSSFSASSSLPANECRIEPDFVHPRDAPSTFPSTDHQIPVHLDEPVTAVPSDTTGLADAAPDAANSAASNHSAERTAPE